VKFHAANALWVASCRPEWQRFTRAAEHVKETQAALLSRYLNTNKITEYGRRHQFNSLASPAQYQARVPLSTYDDYTEYITRIGQGQAAVLTAGPVRMFELSSGSSAASKLIPYTDSVKAEFQRGLAPWIYNLYSHIPDLQRGPAYWSITPLTGGKRFTPGGIPIGFESDSAYLGPLGRWLLESVLAVPNTVKSISDINDFRYVTLLHLLRQRELRLISVWNPTFLTLLLESLKQCWEALLRDIERGTVSLPSLTLRFKPDPRLAQTLRALSPAEPESLWPQLRLVSCWTDGPSAPYARQVEQRFSREIIQGKGLLATEAFVSFPLVGVEGSVLAINSHFFEFISTLDGEPRLAHKLEKGQAYAVVITTGSGFYRYQLHDVVEVVGHWKQVPCIRFVGKADHISDWFGEKLDERFVARTLEKVFAAHGISPVFAMLAPDDILFAGNTNGFHYKLYIESESVHALLAKALDDALCENFHYAWCRKLGQIGAVQVMQVKHGAETYLQICQTRGQKLGNIKPSALQKSAGWKEVFERSG
jgi:hypothetical protein